MLNNNIIYEPRDYRNNLKSERFIHFQVSYKETDLLIAIDKPSFNKDIPEFILKKIYYYRDILNDYFKVNLNFKESFSPISNDFNAHDFIQQMINATAIADIGPMGSVAGAFSQYIGKDVKNKFLVKEIIIENGGDIYLDIKEETIISIYAGNSVLSQKIGIKIMPDYSPLGICTSAGTVGHSISFGKADAVVIGCKNTLIADSFATKYGNYVKTEDDINNVIEMINNNSQFFCGAIIKNDKIGLCGKFDFVSLG